MTSTDTDYRELFVGGLIKAGMREWIREQNRDDRDSSDKPTRALPAAAGNP